MLLEVFDAAGASVARDHWRGELRISEPPRPELATGVGLPYQDLLMEKARKVPVSSGLAARLRRAGLEIHPYTLRRDQPPKADFGFDELLRFLIHETGVDALFTDQPDIALRVRDRAD